MQQYKLGEMEAKFADIIWENCPITSGELVKLCENQLMWKKSTTYTMLKRLCQRDIFANEGGVVKPLMTKDEFLSAQTQQILNDSFNGSLPQFLTAFSRKNKLTESEITQLRRLIDGHREE